MKKDIMPIVVLYKKELHEAESINSLLDADFTETISHIYVYDNTPESYGSKIPDHNLFRGREVTYIQDFNNSGVSVAYNSGLEKAVELGFKHVLLLDQDTVFPVDSLEVYKASFEKNPEIDLHVPRLVTKNGELCSPLKYAMHRGFVTNNLETGIYSLKKYSPINSGMLLNVEKARLCGGYNNNVYLDFSDFQFIERLQKVSDRFFLMPLTLKQDLSNEDVNHGNLLTRYAIYCDCAKNCERKTIVDDFIYFMMVLVRGLKLTLRTKKVEFLNIFMKKYLRGRK